ncbi:hypothetical protein COTS27_01444 [Spirochaetota bacterium]|nr:hypothetical protein COTS27_01444 [Spirochaetota bacterium]
MYSALPYLLSVVLVVLAAFLYPEYSLVMKSYASALLIVSGVVFLLVMVSKWVLLKRHIYGKGVHFSKRISKWAKIGYYIIISLSLALSLAALFLLGYQEPEEFYDNVYIPEPWVKGYVFRGRVLSDRGQGPKYHELLVLIETIGRSQKKRECAILYEENLSLRTSKRVLLKIKTDDRENDGEKLAQATHHANRKIPLGSTVIIKPYYHRSTQTIKQANYRSYLYHRKQVGSIYVTPKYMQVIEAYNGFNLPIIINNYVVTTIQRYVTKEFEWQGKIKTANQGISALKDSVVIIPSQYDRSQQPAYGLSLSLLTGDRRWLAKEIVEDFRQTGTYHVLAISGMHTGMIMLVFFSLLRLFRMSKRHARAMIIFILFPVYLMIVGPRVSVLRSVLMIAFGFLWTVRDQKSPLYILWAQILLLMLLVNPYYAYDVSFQLSFSAVLGVILGLQLLVYYSFKNSVLNWVLATWVISVSCQLFTMPFILYYFTDVNMLAPLYNMIIPPLVIIVLLGTIFLVLLPLPGLAPLLGLALAYLNEAISDLLAWIVAHEPALRLGYPSQFPLAKSHWSLLGLFLLIFAGFCVILMAAQLRRPLRFKRSIHYS